MLNLPRASQHARLTQRIGITDITVDYHRPLVRGRTIFGGVHAYGQVWRAGANENVTLDFSDPVTIEGHPVAKGLYGVHMVPNRDAWIIILSRNATSWGSFTYDQSEDVLRVTVKPERIANQEALTYAFDQPTADSTLLTMRWEQVAVHLSIGVNTPAIVEQDLRKQLRGRAQFEWQPWTEAANYLLTSRLSAEQALAYADRAIEIEDRFESEITKAFALTTLGRNDAARVRRDKAGSLGTQLQVHDFARGLQAQGRHAEALDLFALNIRKDPDTWVGHNNAARLAVARADFQTAVLEMTRAVAAAPPSLKGQHADLVRRLENHEDINK
ncbi:MAG: DUF2911 domain-containing protein [Vicinamibacterales bacterium]